MNYKAKYMFQHMNYKAKYMFQHMNYKAKYMFQHMNAAQTYHQLDCLQFNEYQTWGFRNIRPNNPRYCNIVFRNTKYRGKDTYVQTAQE